MITNSKRIHRAVMPREILEAVKPHSGGRYLDATLGASTHSLSMLEASAPNGQVVSLDVDPAALKHARELAKDFKGRWTIVESNFRDMDKVEAIKKLAPYDGIIFDLGISSDELEDPEKGLSFKVEGPLDMRLGPKANQDGLTAEQIVNTWSKEDLSKMLENFGEERYAARIAEKIVTERKTKKFRTTTELAEAVAAAVPKNYEKGRLHPATRTFQALRIAVNDELESLRIALQAAYGLLAEGGSMAVISFHSLEDRIVKQTFKQYQNATVSKKPIVPSEEELNTNPRSRSAKLRIATKISNTKNNNYAVTIRSGYDETTPTLRL